MQFFLNYPIFCTVKISFYLCVFLINSTCHTLLNGLIVKCRFSCPKPLVQFPLIKSIPSLQKAHLTSARAWSSCIFILFSSTRTCPRQREQHLWSPGGWHLESEGVGGRKMKIKQHIDRGLIWSGNNATVWAFSLRWYRAMERL